MNSVVVLFGLATLTYIFWYVRDRVRNAERDRLLNGLKKLPVRSFPLVGQMWYFLGSTKRFFRLLDEALAKLETPFVVWFGIVPSVHLTRLEDIEDVSKVCANRNTYGLLEGTIEDGIIAQNHEKWKRTRRLMTPAFGHVMLTQYIQVFDEQSRILTDMLQPEAAKGELFDLWPFLINANIDIITENMMGVQPGCQRNQGNEYSEALLKLIFETLNRLINPLLYPNFVFKIYSHLVGLPHNVKIVQEYPSKTIDEAMKKKDNIIEYRERTSLSSVYNIPKHMIDILLVDHLRDANNMTAKQMRNEMIHLTAAGSETTAVGVALLMLMFGMHQVEQENAYQEIKTVTSDDHPVTIEEVNQLEYLDKTIKETLRLFSVVPTTFRSTPNALTLSSGDTIPGDTEIFLHLKHVHENLSYYPNPTKWNPENFSAEAIRARPQNSFAAFGLGLRACLGSKYAMLTMKVQAIHLLRKYRILTNAKLDELVIDQDILCRSRNGYFLKLQLRQSQTTFTQGGAVQRAMK